MLRDVFQPIRRLRQFASVRFKLVTWFVAVLALVLVGFTGALLGLVQRNLHNALNERLITHTEQVADLVELQEGQLLFAKLDEINVEYDSLRSFSVSMFDTEGEPVWKAVRNQLPSSDALEETLQTNQSVLSTMNLPFERYRVVTRPIRIDGEVVGVMQAGLSLRDIDDAMTKLIIGSLVTIPGALIFVAIGGWFLAAKALRPIEENLARQRQFIQDASHELRTPLAIIQSNIDVSLQNPNPTVKQLQDKLNTVRGTTKRMGKIITDLFTLSNSDSQSMRLKPRLISMEKAARDVVKQMRSLARKKKQELLLGDAEELMVHADEDRIKQVLTILIDNAIKYTQDGGTIMVTVSKTPAIDYAKISVVDNGPGITKESQEKIFERFYRVDKSRSRDLGGNGLGLAIANSLLKKQRGYLSVQSKIGKGTHFDVFLPLVSKRTGRGFALPRLFSMPTRNSKEASKKS